jgi:hypothetical protein
VIPVGGVLAIENKSLPSLRAGGPLQIIWDYFVIPVGGVLAIENKSLPSLRAGGLLQKSRTSSELESCLFAKSRAVPQDLFSFAERVGFEPTNHFWRLHTFQACAFDHSAISPDYPCFWVYPFLGRVKIIKKTIKNR